MLIPVAVCLFVVHQHGVFDLQVIILSGGGGDGALGDDHEHDDELGADHAEDD